MTYQNKQTIIVYIARSVGKSGHIVSQVAQDLLAFHNDQVDFVMISPRDFKIDLCLELQGLRDYAKLESTKIAFNIIEEAISVKIENELLTTNQTTGSITNSSFEMIDGGGGALSEFLKGIQKSSGAEKTFLYIPWWGMHTIEELQRIGHLADKNKIEIVIRGEISDVIRRKKNLFNNNGKMLLLANEMKPVKKILFFDSSPDKQHALPLKYRRKTHFVSVHHSNICSKKKTSLALESHYTIGFYGLLSSARGLGLFTYLALINPKIKFEAYGNSKPNENTFPRVSRIPLVGHYLQCTLQRILKIFAGRARNLDLMQMVWRNSVAYNNQIANVQAVFSAGNRSHLASGLSLHALSIGTPVLFTKGNSANSDILMENFPQGKLSLLDFLMVNRLSTKIKKIGDIQAIELHSHEQYSRDLLSAFQEK